MAKSEELSWIELTDFSPGIFSNNNLAGGSNVTSDNPCKAQEALTFRCRSLPTGGLGPLPRRKQDFTLTTPPGSEAATTYRVCGLNTWGSTFTSDLNDTDQSHRAEIHLALDFHEAIDNSRHLDWIRERIFDDTPTTETILSRDFAASAAGTPRFAYFHKTRMRTSTPLEPGFPVMTLIWAANPIGGDDDNRISRAHPDPDFPDTNDTVVIGDEGEAYTISAAHQGRMVLGKFLAYDRGVDAGVFTNENFVWTNVNLPTLSTTTPAVFQPEVDQYVTDVATMSANTFLVIKTIGGGYVLQGDLDDVTVVSLPNLMCADGSDTVRGTQTPSGYVYSAGDAGLYVWNGGDSARPFTPQLDGQTFTTGVTRDGNNGQCDRWQDLLLAPRNWVMDLDTEGWWRIDDPDDLLIRFWSTSKWRSQTYGAPASFLEDDTAFAMWEMDDLAYSWSWQSHPLWISQDRRMEVRAGIVALQGHGSVTITLTDEDGNTSIRTIAVDSDIIRNYRWDIGLDAENLTVLITSEGHALGDDDATSEAPLVHRAFLGYRPAQHLRNVAN